MLGITNSRKDDLESYFYTLADLAGFTVFNLSLFRNNPKIKLDLSPFSFLKEKEQRRYLA